MGQVLQIRFSYLLQMIGNIGFVSMNDISRSNIYHHLR